MEKPPVTAQSIVDHAQQIRDAEQRRAYLDRVCDGDAELRQRVEAMLSTYDPDARGSDHHIPTLATNEGSSPRSFNAQVLLPSIPLEGIGSRIGPYKLLQQIGEGGMGAVFMAEQQQPVRRMVALKVIKAGMDSAQVIARFEAERQALALMDHPHIAKVLDAGTTQSGRPYFVMELVKGIPITKYCDEQRLTLQQRLELFMPVCQAIQHAHQKGIIHRDIKPSNVLVASYDGRPVPKVIDFGVAKAMGAKLTDHTVFTGFGALIGTLEYMSPEQAEFNALDIDTRSDIYSLGVLLYELLTGTTPLTRQRLKDAAILEVLRLIREEEAPRPSTRLSEAKESLASVSAQRHLEPSALVKAMRGEVDWIVMKALEKDRTRRYETANGLARDIQRYLAEEPVEAGPPSAAYRLRKLAWKHRRGLTTAAALLLLLVAGVAVSTSLAVRASHAEKNAVEERNRALAAEEDAKAVLEFFQDNVLSAGRPEGQEGGQGREVTLRKAVEAAAEKIAAAFTDRPLVEASIRDALGLSYYYLGEYPKAIEQHERALALREAQSGNDRPDTLTARNNLANDYLAADRTNDAIRLHEQNLKQREAQLGPDHRAVLLSGRNLAEAYRKDGRLADAMQLLEQIRTRSESALGPDDPDTLDTCNKLALAYWSAGRTNEAIRLHEETLTKREAKLGPNHPETLSSRNNLAAAYRAAGRFNDAIRLHEQNVKLQEAKLGTDHPSTLRSRNNLAEAYRAAGHISEAIRLLEQSLRQSESKFGDDGLPTLHARNNLAVAYWSANRFDDAIRLHQKNLKLREAKLGRDHSETLQSRNNLATALWSAGHLKDAIPLHEQNLKLYESKLGIEHPQSLNSRNNLATAYWSAGRLAEAIRLHGQNVKIMEAKLGPDHPDTLSSRNNLAKAYLDDGRRAEAVRLLEQTLPQQEAKIGADHPDTLATRNNLASAYDQDRQFAKAEPLYRLSLEQARKSFGAEDRETALQLVLLGMNLLHQHKYADAEPLLRDCLQIRKVKQPEVWSTFSVQSQLGEALLGQKKYAEAEPLLLTGYQGMKQREAKIPAKGKVRLSEALERLVQLYEAISKKDQADKWRKELRAAKGLGKS